MLALASKTDPIWVQRVSSEMDTILLDHAHLEKRAASTAVKLIFRYTQHTPLMVPLSKLAREELRHFELVVELLERRGVPFRRIRPGGYARGLMSHVRSDEPHLLLDTLICASLIEARSCERMTLLANGLEDPELVSLYRGLLACEARHFGIYVELAKKLFPDDLVQPRLQELSMLEAEVVAGLPREARLHSN